MEQGKRIFRPYFFTGFIVIVALLATTPLSAAPHTLPELLLRLEQLPSFTAARSAFDAAKAGTAAERGALPDPILSYQADKVDKGLSQSMSTLSLKQPLPLGDRPGKAGRVAEALEKAAFADVHVLKTALRQRLLSEAARWYWKQEEARTLLQTADAWANLSAIARSRYATSGLGLPTLSRLELRSVQARDAALATQADAENAVIQVKLLSSLDDPAFSLTDPGFGPDVARAPILPPPSELFASWEKNNPSRAKLASLLLAQQAGVELAALSWVPDLALMATVTMSSDGLSSVGVGAELSLPSWSLGSRIAAPKAANAKRGVAQADLANASREARSRIDELVLSITRGRQRLNIVSDAAKKIGPEYSAHMLDEFSRGQAELESVIEALDATASMQVQADERALELWMNLFELEALTGLPAIDVSTSNAPIPAIPHNTVVAP